MRFLFATIGVLTVTVILPATLGGCNRLIIDDYWVFQLDREQISFTEQSEQLTIYRFLEFPAKEGSLHIYGYGSRRPDSSYVLELKLETRDVTEDEHLIFAADKVRAKVGDTELKVRRTSKEIYDSEESSSLTEFYCPLSAVRDTTTERVKEPHIEITIDLSSFVWSNGEALALGPVYAVQRVPIPLRERQR